MRKLRIGKTLVILALFGLVPWSATARSTASGSRVSDYQHLTGDDPEALENRWDAVFKQSKDYVYGKDPSPFLVESLPLLPPRGKVLDLAMAEGRNAVFMAKKGYQVEGVDISEAAIRRAKRLARENKVRIKTIVADLASYQIRPDTYDVILSIFYLDRKLLTSMKKGLRRGGVIVFENHTEGNLKYDKTEPKEYLLAPGELRQLFSDFQVLKYREEDNGKEVSAALVARKP